MSTEIYLFKANYFKTGSRIFLAYCKKRKDGNDTFSSTKLCVFSTWLTESTEMASNYVIPKPRQNPVYRWPFSIHSRSENKTFFFFGNTILHAKDIRLLVPINKVTVWQYSDNQLRQQVAKLLRHFHEKTPFLGGGGGRAAVWEIIGKLIALQEGEVSPLFLQLAVALIYITTKLVCFDDININAMRNNLWCSERTHASHIR